MHKLPLEIQTEFFKLYSNEISIADFEKWLYSSKELEQILDYEKYIELVSLNFKDRDVMYEMGKLVNPYLDLGKLEERKLRKILTDIRDRTEDFAKSLIATYDLYCSGYYFLDHLGMGYGLYYANDYFDYKDWEKLTALEKEIRINSIHHLVKKEAEVVLKWLDEGKIVLTGGRDEDERLHYKDNRANAEKGGL